MMRKLFAVAVLLLVPSVAQAQNLELGLDMGLILENGFDTQDDVTNIVLPAPFLRAGYGVSENLSIEGLVSFNRASSDGTSLSTLLLLPGVNFQMSEDFYLRGEVGLQRVSFDTDGFDDSATQLGFGVAAGMRRAINDGPVSWRIEGGFTRWAEDEDAGQEAYNAIRLLFGFSAVVN